LRIGDTAANQKIYATVGALSYGMPQPFSRLCFSGTSSRHAVAASSANVTMTTTRWMIF